MWLLTAGGALFAAFGGWYATMFTAFYLPLLIILVGLIVRVCAIEWRGKINDPRRACGATWASASVRGSRPAVGCGVRQRGARLPIDADARVHGGFLQPAQSVRAARRRDDAAGVPHPRRGVPRHETTGVLQRDAMDLAAKLAIPTAVVAAVFLLWTQFSYGSGWTMDRRDRCRAV